MFCAVVDEKVSLLASMNYGALKEDLQFVFSKMQRSI